MAVIQIKADNKKIKELNLDYLITNDKLIEAICNKDKNKLRDLILEVANFLKKDCNVIFEDFYYAEHVHSSNELFDMFASEGLRELFSLFGFNSELVKLEDLNEDIIQKLNINNLNAETDIGYKYWVGALKIFNDEIEFYMYAEQSMHDNFLSIFVDTKRATYKLNV